MSHDHPAKAYRNIPFLTSPPARPLRILAEYEEPRQRFKEHGVEDTIVFFGSARSKSPEQLVELEAAGTPVSEQARRLSEYYQQGRELAARITTWSWENFAPDKQYFITTGGGPGMMEAANRGAAESGGLTVGLGVSLPSEQGLNAYVSPSLGIEFHYFFLRKYWFAYLAKAIVALPGGFGTLDEVLEVMTLVQTGKIKKHLPVVLYGRDFWTSVLDVDALERWGTVSSKDRRLFHISDSVDDAFVYLSGELSRA